MGQEILVGLIFIAALFWLGRFLYRQATAPKSEQGTCEKCNAKKTVTKE